jgi:hypothetical protein
LVLTGAAGDTDTVQLYTADGMVYATSQASVLNLKQNWASSEFNVFGLSDGSQAQFNLNATIVVQTLTQTQEGLTSPPGCQLDGTTAETNNLYLVPGSCCQMSGAVPGIRFVESNRARAEAGEYPCPPAAEAVKTGAVRRVAAIRRTADRPVHHR